MHYSASTAMNTNHIWQSWNAVSYATTTATSITNTNVWPIWASETSSGSTDGTWRTWITTYSNSASTTANLITPTLYQRVERQHVPVDPAVEAAARVEREQRAAAYEAARVEEARRAALADERAMRLLVSVLSEQQQRDLAAHDYFFVDAPVSGRRYRIDKGRSGNVKVIDRQTGVWTESLCIHQRENVPVADTMLIQKLLIETAEDAFRETANITFRDGRHTYSRGLLDGARLGQVLQFPSREREAA